MELPRLSANIQRNMQNSVSWNEDCFTEVGSCDLTDSECQKESIKSSTCSRFRPESEDGVVYDDTHPSRNSKKRWALLQGIIEADETYIGGKPRKPNKRENENPQNADVARRKTLSSVLSKGMEKLSHNLHRT